MADTKPDVTIPDGEPPADLLVEDIEVGDGAEARTRDFFDKLFRLHRIRQ